MPDCPLFVGTSGYSYAEWVEAGFYPQGTPSARMLSFYAQRFSVTELNYTWYQMPRADAVERHRSRVPPGFLFAAKLTRTLTHEIDPKNWKKDAASYRDGIAPLFQAGQLAAVLIQLPPSFARTPGNRKYLAALTAELEGLPLAVEFRHRSWADPNVFGELEKRRITLVSVDAPDLPELFPLLDAVTCPELFYIRFHGRNAKGWRSGKMHLQFDYSYSDDELKGWIENRIAPMAETARRGILFFNNHVRAQAPENAERLIRLLKEHGFSAV
ncbi:MAG: DUF72 domain-containing protein [Deltaproteobacteria bacterium]|nr:DUF72 domain-containing protein [Deltaproteobacteria bacterium]MBW2043243.1 DUF72 domain-containing protein [Deltaproteobacteria bacterium]MBW2133532.1 DUF72 domain-containing protein [Deltaproteobacteria bacterium]